MTASRCEHALSVVIIGRNDIGGLSRCLDSLDEQLAMPRMSYEVIYVDGGSKDGSARLAAGRVDVVVTLEDDDVLSASAGRHHGTKTAHSPWILYLDSDMELAQEFGHRIPQLIRQTSERKLGYAGLVVNVFNDGTSDPNAKHYRQRARTATHFGGAILLPRELVLEAGNWSDRIYSNEEIDLLVRLRAEGGHVSLLHVPMAVHHAGPPLTAMGKVGRLAMVDPSNRRTWGLGQMARLRLANGQFHLVVRYFPDPFVVWLSVFALIAGVVMQQVPLVALAAIGTVFVWSRRGIRYVVVAQLLLIHLVNGWNKLPQKGPRVAGTMRVRRCGGRTW